MVCIDIDVNEGRQHHDPLLGDVVFFLGSTQLSWTMWGQADRVAVRFRSSKRDQLLTLIRAMATLGEVRRSAETSCMVCVSTAIATWAVSTTTHSPDSSRRKRCIIFPLSAALLREGRNGDDVSLWAVSNSIRQCGVRLIASRFGFGAQKGTNC